MKPLLDPNQIEYLTSYLTHTLYLSNGSTIPAAIVAKELGSCKTREELLEYLDTFSKNYDPMFDILLTVLMSDK